MRYVYILQSERDKRLYIGSTGNLRGRLSRHGGGYVRSTKRRRPLRLVYYECYLSTDDAMQREVYLKGGAGREILKVQLRNTFAAIRYHHRK